MKISALALSACVLTATSLVVPSIADDKEAIAGPIASSNVTERVNSAIADLKDEYGKLESLKQNIYDLQHKVHHQEHEILNLINKDYASCSGIKCYLQKAIAKTPDYLFLVKTHFRHHPKNVTAFPCPWTDSRTHAEGLPFDFNGPNSNPESHENHGDNDKPTLPYQSVPSASPGPDVPFNSADVPHDSSFDSGPPAHHPQPGWHPGHHGLPPPPPHHPGPAVESEFNPNKPNPAHSADRTHHRPHHDFHMPHPAPRHRHYKLILTIAGMTVSFLILAILLKAINIYLSNPRVQADRAARREEFLTKREYRRAACQHRFRQFFRCRTRCGTGSTGDDEEEEEKRAMLQQGQGQRRSDIDSNIASHVVGADIASLRRAHEIVDQLMRAEEGLQGQGYQSQHDGTRQYHSPSMGVAHAPPIPGPSRSICSLQTTQTTSTQLPAYAPPPPRYSMELSRDMEVVDGFGFRYNPHHDHIRILGSAHGRSQVMPNDIEGEVETASSVDDFVFNDEDLCTESSVADCQSRMSIETDSVAPSLAGAGEAMKARGRKSLELAGDRFRGRFS